MLDITKLVLVLSMRNITIMDSRQVVMNILKLRLISSLNVNFPAGIFSDERMLTLRVSLYLLGLSADN